jgi:hypothetical protein
MKKLSLLLICALALNANAGGFTDSDGTLTDYVNQTATLNMSPADVFAACKVADLVTTKLAFARGAVEGNALLAGMSFTGIALVGVAAIGVVYWLQNHYGDQASTGINIASAITCGVAGHNLFVN